MHRDLLTDLEREELAARIKAARLLRDMSQAELSRRVAQSGLPFRLVGQLERCETEFRSVHRAVLAEVLCFPERWFSEPLDDVFPERRDETTMDAVLARLEMIEALLRKGS